MFVRIGNSIVPLSNVIAITVIEASDGTARIVAVASGEHIHAELWHGDKEDVKEVFDKAEIFTDENKMFYRLSNVWGGRQ